MTPATRTTRGAGRASHSDDRLRRQLEHRPIERDLGMPNRELRGVDADRDASRPGIEVIAGERPLPPLIEPARRGERQRMRGNDQATAQGSDNAPAHVCPAAESRSSPSMTTTWRSFLMLRLVRSTLLAGMAALALGGCSDSTGTDIDTVAGVYTLVTIDGQQLPVIVSQTVNEIVEITAGEVSLDGNLTFDDITNLRLTQSGAVTTEVDATTGAWALNGSTVVFTPNDNSGGYTMTWNGQDRLTQIFQGLTLVYER